ncbi:MAG: hypothetical protein ABFD64_08920 [Armatimonadota bacterium]
MERIELHTNLSVDESLMRLKNSVLTPAAALFTITSMLSGNNSDIIGKINGRKIQLKKRRYSRYNAYFAMVFYGELIEDPSGYGTRIIGKFDMATYSKILLPFFCVLGVLGWLLIMAVQINFGRASGNIVGRYLILMPIALVGYYLLQVALYRWIGKDDKDSILEHLRVTLGTTNISAPIP